MARKCCEKCGKAYFNGEKFCSACGGRVIVKKKSLFVPVIISLMLLAVLGVALVLWGSKAFSGADSSGQERKNPFQNAQAEQTDAQEEIHSYYYTYLVDSPYSSADGFWVNAVPRDWSQGEGERYDAFDVNLNYLYSVDGERYEAYGGIFEGYALARDHEKDEELVVFDPAGNDITERFVVPDSVGWIVGLCKDETGVTVWNCEYRISEEGIGIALCAKDTDGQQKSIYNMTDYLFGGRNDLEFYGGSIYIFNGCMLNVSNGIGKAFPDGGTQHTYLGVDEENNYFMQFWEEGYTVVDKYDATGENLWTIALESGAEVGIFHGGHIYIDGIQMDTHRHLYGLLNPYCQILNWESSAVEYKNTPVFTDGCAPVEFENEDGESVVTLLNLMGEWMYPPIPGTVVPRNKEYVNEFNIADRLIRTGEGLANLNEDGTITILVREENAQGACLIRCGDHIYRVEDGELFEDTELKAELARANPSSISDV